MSSKTETYTSDTDWSVPSEVTEVEIDVRGSPGGDGSHDSGVASPGADGGEAHGILSVSDTDTLYLRFYAGGNGPYHEATASIWADAGDGGTGSVVHHNGTAAGDVVIAAGGGAGGGAGAGYDPAGDSVTVETTAGAPGGASGGDAADAVNSDGGGATAAGGTGGGASTLAGGDGALDSSDYHGMCGGGGGGGYNGGTGGGAAYDAGANPNAGAAAGGGGGDGYTGGVTSASSSQGSWTQGAEIVLTYEPLPASFSVTVSQVDPGAVTLDIGDSEYADGYRVYRDGQQVDTLSAGAQTWEDTGLDQGTQYTWTVEAYNGTGTTSEQVSATTDVLAGASNLTVDTEADTSIAFSWQVNDSQGQQRVDYRRSSESAWTTFSSGLALSVSSETVTGLRNGEEYDLRVVTYTDHAMTVDQS